jgi:hypothetical protein
VIDDVSPVLVKLRSANINNVKARVINLEVNGYVCGSRTIFKQLCLSDCMGVLTSIR